MNKNKETKHYDGKQQMYGEDSDAVNEKTKESHMQIAKTPSCIELEGPLADIFSTTVYHKIHNELANCYSKHKNNIFECVAEKHRMSSRNDMAVLEVIDGYEAAGNITGDLYQSLKRIKEVRGCLNTYSLKNYGIILSLIDFILFDFYMRLGKPGKAIGAFQRAVACIQQHAPSTWTALIYAEQGYVYDRLIQTFPHNRINNRKCALKYFTLAREHCLCVQHLGNMFLYLPMLFTLHIIHVTLDIPTIPTLSYYHESDILYQRLIQFNVSETDLTKVQDMLKAIVEKKTELNTDLEARVQERIVLVALIMNIRLTQFNLKKKEYQSAKQYLDMAFELNYDWTKRSTRFKNPVFTDNLKGNNLSKNIGNVLDDLHHKLKINLDISSTFETKSEPISDSLSSEPDVTGPPSGLKSLTDESMRTEKEGRQCNVCYSSGDIQDNSDSSILV